MPRIAPIKVQIKESYLALLYFFFPIILVAMPILLTYFLSKNAANAMFAVLSAYLIPVAGQYTAPFLGINLGLSPISVALWISYVEVNVGLFVALNFVHLRKLKSVNKFLEKTQRSGEEFLNKHKKLSKLTIPALAVFIFIPVQGSGPIAAALVGRILGIRVLDIAAGIFLGAVLKYSVMVSIIKIF